MQENTNKGTGSQADSGGSDGARSKENPHASATDARSQEDPSALHVTDDGVADSPSSAGRRDSPIDTRAWDGPATDRATSEGPSVDSALHPTERLATEGATRYAPAGATIAREIPGSLVASDREMGDAGDPAGSSVAANSAAEPETPRSSAPKTTRTRVPARAPELSRRHTRSIQVCSRR